MIKCMQTSAGLTFARAEPKSPEALAEWRATSSMSPGQIADEYGDCDLKCTQNEKFEKRRKELGAAILLRHDDVPPEQAAVQAGERWSVRIAARQHETKIKSIKAVLKAMGAEAFYGACKIALKDVKDALGEVEASKLVTVTRTGYRKLESVWAGPPESRKAA